MPIKIYCDGGSKGNPGPSSLGVWATENGDGNSGEEVFSISKKLGLGTNNEAEWQSLLHGIRKAKELSFEEIMVFMDSELVVKQVLGQYKIKKPEFIPYFKEVQELIPSFKSFSLSHVRREFNKKADSLANLAFRD